MAKIIPNSTENSTNLIKNYEDGIFQSKPPKNGNQGLQLCKSIRSYPKGVFFMLGNEFCERFSYYGMQTILAIYLTTEHGLSESLTKQIFHSFVSLAYFSSIMGSILADNYFGRFRVILWVSLLYVAGHALLSIGAIPTLAPTFKSFLDYFGLFVIALATGGIKPSVSAFAADQFEESQRRERAQFFSFFYLSINIGSLIAMTITPLLRKTSCLNSEHCFPLAFGVPGILMFLSFIIFLSGWKFYKIEQTTERNILWRMAKCIGHALGQKCRQLGCRQYSAQIPQSKHWLDCAVPIYGQQLVDGVKRILSIVVLYLPIAVYFALADQQGSTWILQARKMNGRVGYFRILPDQMHIFNPLVIIIFVPLFEAYVYPLANKLVKVTPLRKMALGGIIAAISYCIAGFLQLQINGTMETGPDPGNVFLFRLGNSTVQFADQKGIRIPETGKYEIPARNYKFHAENGMEFKLNLASNSTPKNAVFGIYEAKESRKLIFQKFYFNSGKMDETKMRIYFLLTDNSPLGGTLAFALDQNGKKVSTATISNGNFIDIQPGFFSPSENYRIVYGNCTMLASGIPNCQRQHQIQIGMGAAFVLDLIDSDSKKNSMVQLVRPNIVNIAWQIPQIVVITIGEILLCITGLEFSYSQAPASMKSVLQALFLLTIFGGNAIDIIISRIDISDPATEFFVYAAMMFAVMGVFIILAMRYQYAEEEENMSPNVHLDFSKQFEANGSGINCESRE